MEVTRVTDDGRRKGRDALKASHAAEAPRGDLQTCWLVVVSDKQDGLKTLRQRVHLALMELESADRTFISPRRAADFANQDGPMSSAYQVLLDAGITRASPMPDHRHQCRAHRVILSPGSGGTAGSSDEALRLLVEKLNEKKREDNAKKLRASDAWHRHLFVWLDDDTRFDIARPLSREELSRHDGFGLPSTPPTLDPAVIQLWVVHEGSRLGWLWDGQTWRELRDL